VFVDNFYLKLIAIASFSCKVPLTHLDNSLTLKLSELFTGMFETVAEQVNFLSLLVASNFNR